MDATEERLTLWEASAVVAGLGIGGGVLAVPYLASLSGWLPTVVLMTTAFVVSVGMHLMIAEMVVNQGEPKQLVEALGQLLFRGRFGQVGIWTFFALTVTSFLTLLSGYIAAVAPVVAAVAGSGPTLSKVLVYFVAAGFAFYGLKFIAVCEKYALALLGAVLAFLVVIAASHSWQAPAFAQGDWEKALAFFSMLMFCFSAFFAMPQVARGLSWNVNLIPKAMFIGIGINFLTVAVITTVTILVSGTVTRDALVSLAASLGGSARIAGLAIVALAVLTSYWGFSFALATVIQERMRLRYRPAWLLATLPSLLLTLFGADDALAFLRYSGGAMAVLVALLIVPALRKSRRLAGSRVLPGGFWQSRVFEVVVVVAYLAMILGAFVTGV